jgi:hypothetical protein
MATDRDPADQQGEAPPWLGVARFAFIALLTAMIFLLGRSMLRNHFFDGGQMSRRDADGQ